MPDPANFADLLRNAETYLERRDLLRAIVSFKRAEVKGAPADACCAGRWLAHMLRGDFEDAWRESDSIRHRGSPDPQRLWLGEALYGQRVIVRCLHGLGDSVQFLRYAPLIQKRAAKLIVEVPPALVELAQFFDGIDEVITWGAHAPAVSPEWDVQIEINQLPYVFRTASSDLPVAKEYLHLPLSLVRDFCPQPATSSCLRVGFLWASGTWDPSRSIPLRLLNRLLRTQDCEFWNLQGGAAREEWSLLRDYTNLHEGEGCSDSLLGLAALLAQMDVVITPDTLAAHLAGALNVPAFVMLQYAADWRWMERRNDSPWYPSLRLFRQQESGDWSGLIDKVQSALNRTVRLRGQRHVPAGVHPG